MKYCVDCGQPVAQQIPRGDNRLRQVCTGCGTVQYVNPRVLVGCIVYVGEKVLVGRRAYAPRVGLWSSPSGFMEQGESLEQAAARETFEEMGVRVDPDELELYFVISLPELSQVYVTFRTELKAMPEINAGPECLEVKMIQESEIERSQIAFPVMLGEDSLSSIVFREIRGRSFAIHKWCVEKSTVRSRGSRAYSLTRAVRDEPKNPHGTHE